MHIDNKYELNDHVMLKNPDLHGNPIPAVVISVSIDADGCIGYFCTWHGLNGNINRMWFSETSIIGKQTFKKDVTHEN